MRWAGQETLENSGDEREQVAVTSCNRAARVRWRGQRMKQVIHMKRIGKKEDGTDERYEEGGRVGD